MLVAPGVNSKKGQNPGVAYFEVDSDFTPRNLKMEFLNLEPTLGMKSMPAYEQLEFFSVDFNDYSSEGLTDLSAHAMNEFRKYLELSDNKEYTLNYLVKKLGFDPKDPDQYQSGLNVLISKDLISTKKHKTGEYICQMQNSSSATEYSLCCEAVNPSLFLQ